MAVDPACGIDQARRLGDLLKGVIERLSETDIDTARIDARLLIAEATAGGETDALLYPEREIGAAAMARLDALIQRRLAREPMSQILGVKGFRNLDLAVSPDVLTPRPDTETVIEAILARIGTPEGRILDLGTGSGCLILALLDELPGSTGVAVDISPAALAVARKNADALGLADRVTFYEGSWFDALTAERGGMFDLIVSNPPYIPSGDIAALAPEVRDHEPRVALDGGDDGLDAYRAIVAGLSHYLAPGGRVVFEVGVGQAAVVAAMLSATELRSIEITDDLSGIGRTVMAQNGSGSEKKRVGKGGVSRLG